MTISEYNDIKAKASILERTIKTAKDTIKKLQTNKRKYEKMKESLSQVVGNLNAANDNLNKTSAAIVSGYKGSTISKKKSDMVKGYSGEVASIRADIEKCSEIAQKQISKLKKDILEKKKFLDSNQKLYNQYMNIINNPGELIL